MSRLITMSSVNDLRSMIRRLILGKPTPILASFFYDIIDLVKAVVQTSLADSSGVYKIFIPRPPSLITDESALPLDPYEHRIGSLVNPRKYDVREYYWGYIRRLNS